MTVTVNSFMNAQCKNWKIERLKGVEFVVDTGSAEYPDHVHNAFTLDLVESGSIEYRIGPHRIEVNEGSLIWIGRHEVHGGRQLGTRPLRIRSFLIPFYFIDSVFDEVHGSQKTSRVICSNQRLFNRISSLHFAAETSPDPFEVETRLVENLSELLSKDFAATSYAKRNENKAVKKVKEYILQHYSEPISVHHLAELTNLNVSYLVRVFRNHVGLPPYSYLTQLRIANARILLSEGMSPADVAASVGLSDQSHLTRFFKRSTGMTPALYAQRIRNDLAPWRF